MKAELAIVSKLLNVSVSAWIRNVLAHEIRDTLDSLDRQLVLEYARGRIGREKLEYVFGEQMTMVVEAKVGDRGRELAGIASNIDVGSDKARLDNLKSGWLTRIKSLLTGDQTSARAS